MRIRYSLGSKAVLVIFSIALLAICERAVAQQESVLHSFGSGTDGASPSGALISDRDGNLYGTTLYGGAFKYYTPASGAVFEMSPVKGGGWTERVLHSFGGPGDGYGPNGGLVMDTAGNLYGMAEFGGGTYCTDSSSKNVGSFGCGIVFELQRPTSKGKPWAYLTLYHFQGARDGSHPEGPLIFDKAGNLYGTTISGGGNWNATGTVFELSPQAIGYWTVKTLHVFENGSDGLYAGSGVIFDTSGNLLGTTCGGGLFDGGTLFELSPAARGPWTEKILYNFASSSTDGICPTGLTPDLAGNFFGTTTSGGTHNYGIVFELTPTTGGWTEQVLHTFSGGSDGSYSYGSVVLDSLGNLYGSTAYGGIYNGGIVFKLTPSAANWTETILHTLGDGSDGISAAGELLRDAAGNLYGTTAWGGTNTGAFTSGTVFEIVP